MKPAFSLHRFLLCKTLSVIHVILFCILVIKVTTTAQITCNINCSDKSSDFARSPYLWFLT
jgi:hypothetical protein